MQDGSAFAWFLKKKFQKTLIPCDSAEPVRIYKVMMCKVYKLGAKLYSFQSALCQLLILYCMHVAPFRFPGYVSSPR